MVNNKEKVVASNELEQVKVEMDQSRHKNASVR